MKSFLERLQQENIPNMKFCIRVTFKRNIKTNSECIEFVSIHSEFKA